MALRCCSADGNIVYANDTLRVLAQRGDAFRIAGRTIEFAMQERAAGSTLRSGP